MTQIFSLEFLVAILFIIDLFLGLLLFLFVRRVNRIGLDRSRPGDSEGDKLVEQAALRAAEASQTAAKEVVALLEPLVRESKQAALSFEEQIREKRKISRDLNEALDSKMISINLLLSRAKTLQKALEDQHWRMKQAVPEFSLPARPSREPDILDQQNQILSLYNDKVDIDTIAQRLSIPKGEVELVIDLKKKFVAMEQGQ